MSYDIIKTQSTFTRTFWCFLDGRAFSALSPIIHSDACHLSGAFRGTLYITVGMDAERHVFPLCFSTSNVSENKDGWAYHHSQMAAHFGSWRGQSCQTDKRDWKATPPSKTKYSTTPAVSTTLLTTLRRAPSCRRVPLPH